MKIKDVKFIRGAANWKDLMEDGLPEVAFVGRSNVGKSSLINMLVGRRALARTSNTPGKTQEFNYYGINDKLYFVDLPGLGYAKVSKVQRAKWERFIKRYLAEREPLRLVIHLVDSRHDPTRHDLEIMAVMKEGRVPYLIALTKADKLSKNVQKKSIRNLNSTLSRIHLEVPTVLTSSKEKKGNQEIWQWIQDVAL